MPSGPTLPTRDPPSAFKTHTIHHDPPFCTRDSCMQSIFLFSFKAQYVLSSSSSPRLSVCFTQDIHLHAQLACCLLMLPLLCIVAILQTIQNVLSLTFQLLRLLRFSREGCCRNKLSNRLFYQWRAFLSVERRFDG